MGLIIMVKKNNKNERQWLRWKIFGTNVFGTVVFGFWLTLYSLVRVETQKFELVLSVAVFSWALRTIQIFFDWGYILFDF